MENRLISTASKRSDKSYLELLKDVSLPGNDPRRSINPMKLKTMSQRRPRSILLSIPVATNVFIKDDDLSALIKKRIKKCVEIYDENPDKSRVSIAERLERIGLGLNSSDKKGAESIKNQILLASAAFIDIEQREKARFGSRLGFGVEEDDFESVAAASRQQGISWTKCRNNWLKFDILSVEDPRSRVIEKDLKLENKGCSSDDFSSDVFNPFLEIKSENPDLPEILDFFENQSKNENIISKERINLLKCDLAENSLLAIDADKYLYAESALHAILKERKKDIIIGRCDNKHPKDYFFKNTVDLPFEDNPANKKIIKIVSSALDEKDETKLSDIYKDTKEILNKNRENVSNNLYSAFRPRYSSSDQILTQVIGNWTNETQAISDAITVSNKNISDGVTLDFGQVIIAEKVCQTIQSNSKSDSIEVDKMNLIYQSAICNINKPVLVKEDSNKPKKIKNNNFAR